MPKKVIIIGAGISGLSRFSLSSMWAKAPGGIFSAALVDRETGQLMCHEDHKRFTADMIY